MSEEGTVIKLSNIRCPDYYLKERKIGRHSRKLNGQTFTCPRITLPKEYNHLIGKSFFLWDADAEVEYEEYWERRKIWGKALILVIAEEVEETEEDEWDE